MPPQWAAVQLLNSEVLIADSWIIDPFKDNFGSLVWTSALENKTVLIIHSFIETIKCQLRRRDEIFPNSKVLPPFKAKFVRSVMSLGNLTPHKVNHFWKLKFLVSLGCIH